MERSSIPSFRVQITNYTKEDGYVCYTLKVLSTDENSFHITDRYRNMRSLWDEIRKDASNPDRIPDFPPKKWFGSKSREFIEQRRSALQNFFNTLLDSPDKNVFRHIMKYFKKLAKNREAKDALQNIEESVSGNQSVIKQEERKAPQNAPPTQPNQREEAKAAPAGAKPHKPYKDMKNTISSKEYSESCNKIVENFNKKLIDLGYAGADAIQEIIAKGQNYVNHFKDSGINSNFKYDTKMLDIPKGDDDNFEFLENPNEEIEADDADENDKLIEKLNKITAELCEDQQQKYLDMNDIIWSKN